MKKKNSLDQLDQWFSSKGSSASNYFYIGLFLAGLVAYFVLSGYANPYLSESESNLNSATDKLIAAQEEYTNKFNGDPEGFVKTKRNALNAEKTRRDNIIAERTYLDKKLEEISKLTYNEKNWATFR